MCSTYLSADFLEDEGGEALPPAVGGLNSARHRGPFCGESTYPQQFRQCDPHRTHPLLPERTRYSSRMYTRSLTCRRKSTARWLVAADDAPPPDLAAAEDIPLALQPPSGIKPYLSPRSRSRDWGSRSAKKSKPQKPAGCAHLSQCVCSCRGSWVP